MRSSPTRRRRPRPDPTEQMEDSHRRQSVGESGPRRRLVPSSVSAGSRRVLDMPDDQSAPAPPPPAPPEDDLVTTSHSIGAGRTRLRYTTTTGRLVLREEVVEEGSFRGLQPRAQIFSTADVLDDVEPLNRPVTFAFNGGPGSSSAWLHFGLLGPRRVLMGDVGALTRPPYGLTDNLESLLRVSDLVFVDPVTTGYSRTSEGHQADDYHGYTRDLES